MAEDYLKYDAVSMLEYLRKKLIEDGKYTDYAYAGSDTSLLLNLFAWTFECMQYILNSTASDVLFADTTVYDNMNRLVKLLSYRPKAYRSSQCEFSIAGEFPSGTSATYTIPRFTSLETGLNDSDGNPILYSFTEDYSFTVKNGSIQTPAKNPLLTNGGFHVYKFENSSTGSKYEIFQTSDLTEKIDDASMVVFVEWTDDSRN